MREFNPAAIRIFAILTAVSAATLAHADGGCHSPHAPSYVPNVPHLSDDPNSCQGSGQNQGSGQQGWGQQGWGQSQQGVVLQCGQEITANTVLGADMNCAGYTGFALKIVGSGIKFNGNGHKIIAPQALAAIYVQGSNNTITGVTANGVVNGAGLNAYDAPGLVVQENNFSGNEEGILVWAENTSMSNILIFGNIIQNSSLFGIRAGWDTNGQIIQPEIVMNDLSNTGGYALYIQAQQYNMGPQDFNVLYNSLNGIYLKGGGFSITNVSMTQQQIQQVEIFIDSALSVTVNNLDVSTVLPGQPSQQHIGLDLYRCAQFNINGLFSQNEDVGLKLETENGVSPTGTLKNCTFLNENVAAIMITSYDGTPYGVIDVLNSVYQASSKSISLLLSGSTTVPASSIFNFLAPSSNGNGGGNSGDGGDDHDGGGDHDSGGCGH